MSTEGMLCTVCTQRRHRLKTRPSKLSPTVLYLCSECAEKKYEPRWAIILRGRELLSKGEGLDELSDYLAKRRYVGKEITVSELIT